MGAFMENPRQMLSEKKFLVVDDDEQIRNLMVNFLTQQGALVTTASQGHEMKDFLQKDSFDLIILDIMLPESDGFELCNFTRKEGYNTPIIMLTALNEDEERIKGLDLGADDYLTKPFNLQELLARIKAVLRRTQGELKHKASIFEFENWILDKTKRQLFKKEGMEVVLTDGEYRLLEVLLENPKTVLDRDLLLERVENRQTGVFDRSIDVRISRLRQKLGEDCKNPTLIKTVRGGGYILTCDVMVK